MMVQHAEERVSLVSCPRVIALVSSSLARGLHGWYCCSARNIIKAPKPRKSSVLFVVGFGYVHSGYVPTAMAYLLLPRILRQVCVDEANEVSTSSIHAHA